MLDKVFGLVRYLTPEAAWKRELPHESVGRQAAPALPNVLHTKAARNPVPAQIVKEQGVGVLQGRACEDIIVVTTSKAMLVPCRRRIGWTLHKMA